MRRAFGSDDAANGLSDRPCPVSGSMRIIAPSSVAGPSVRRTLWLRSAPPSAVGGLSAVPAGAGGSPHGFAWSPALVAPYWP
jgi:hypothetical protein